MANGEKTLQESLQDRNVRGDIINQLLAVDRKTGGSRDPEDVNYLVRGASAGEEAPTRLLTALIAGGKVTIPGPKLPKEAAEIIRAKRTPEERAPVTMAQIPEPTTEETTAGLPPVLDLKTTGYTSPEIPRKEARGLAEEYRGQKKRESAYWLQLAENEKRKAVASQEQIEDEGLRTARTEMQTQAAALKGAQEQFRADNSITQAKLDLQRERQELLATTRDQDPDRWWKSRTGLQKVTSFLTVLFGAGRPDSGLKLIQSAIDRDIELQKQDYERAVSEKDKAETLYGRLMDRYKDNAEASSRAYSQMLNQFQLEQKIRASTTTDPQMVNTYMDASFKAADAANKGYIERLAMGQARVTSETRPTFLPKHLAAATGGQMSKEEEAGYIKNIEDLKTGFSSLTKVEGLLDLITPERGVIGDALRSYGSPDLYNYDKKRALFAINFWKKFYDTGRLSDQDVIFAIKTMTASGSISREAGEQQYEDLKAVVRRASATRAGTYKISGRTASMAEGFRSDMRQRSMAK